MTTSPSDPVLTDIKIRFPDLPQESLLNELTPMELLLGESLLTPGLQTSIKVHSAYHTLDPRTGQPKNLDDFKNQRVEIYVERPILQKFGLQDNMTINQVVYRLDNRKLKSTATEEFVLRICDRSLLNDAESLVSKLWKCTTPSTIVSEVLSTCAGVERMEIENSDPARDYIAENIHPFQVVAQQATAALANGNDPSFVHYMTYENLGTHHFKSLYKLTKQTPIIKLEYMDNYGQQGYTNPYSLMTHSFPCDFDLLSDILNGINAQGENISTLSTFNSLMKKFNLFGSQTSAGGCGIGQGVPKIASTNEGSAQNQNACPDYTKTYLHKRQARMALLEQDKIALRITVPWCPIYHAGKVIKVELRNKEDTEKYNYGTGNYLIVSMVHNIKYGGFSTTTMDCVAETVGNGGIQ